MTSANLVQLGLVQLRCGADAETNVTRALERIRDAAAAGAQVICLPELFSHQYFCQVEDHTHFALAESIPGPTTERLAELAAALEVVLVASLFERRAPGIYHNTVAVIDADGGLLGKYRKMHIPDDPLYLEKFYFTPGDLGFRTFDTRYGRLGTLVCWDQWFPEAARLTALAGAEILLYPTAIAWHPAEKEELGAAQLASWELIQRSHAVANGCYVAAVNRIGHEGAVDGGLDFWGSSFVCDPTGGLVARASTDQEEVLIAEIDRGAIDAVRTHWPFLRDRRIDAYSGLSKRMLDEEA